jgi:hypothetical protein
VLLLSVSVAGPLFCGLLRVVAWPGLLLLLQSWLLMLLRSWAVDVFVFFALAAAD